MRSAFKMNNFSRQNILKKIDTIKSIIDRHRPFSAHIVGQLRDYYRIGLTQNKRTEVYYSACELVNNHFEKATGCVIRNLKNGGEL